MRLLGVMFLCLSLCAGVARAQPKAQDEVDVVLVLALDVSGSVTADRWEVQRKGYAAALRSPEVLRAVQGGYRGKIAVAYVLWSNPGVLAYESEWSLIDSKDSAAAFAAMIEQQPRTGGGGYTALLNAMYWSLLKIRLAPFKAERRVLDVSGDGRDNVLKEPADYLAKLREIRRMADQLDAVINGLPLLGSELNIAETYEHAVRYGPGSFIVTVEDPSNVEVFAAAVKKKLVREIASLTR